MSSPPITYCSLTTQFSYPLLPPSSPILSPRYISISLSLGNLLLTSSHYLYYFLLLSLQPLTFHSLLTYFFFYFSLPFVFSLIESDFPSFPPLHKVFFLCHILSLTVSLFTSLSCGIIFSELSFLSCTLLVSPFLSPPPQTLTFPLIFHLFYLPMLAFSFWPTALQQDGDQWPDEDKSLYNHLAAKTWNISSPRLQWSRAELTSTKHQCVTEGWRKAEDTARASQMKSMGLSEHLDLGWITAESRRKSQLLAEPQNTLCHREPQKAARGVDLGIPDHKDQKTTSCKLRKM